MTEVRVEDAERVARAMDALSEYVADPKDAMQSIAASAARTAARYAPRRTGRLSRSVRGSSGRGRAVVTATASHAAYVEFGTTRMPASPFLRLADRQMQDDAHREIERDIESAITRTGLA